MRIRSESIVPAVDFSLSNPGQLFTSGFSIGRLSPNNDYDFYNTYLVSGVEYALRAINVSPSLDLVLEFYDTEIEFIGGRNSEGIGADEVSIFTVPITGLYRVGVRSFESKTGGDYILSLNANNVDDFPARSNTTSSLTVNSSVSGNIEIKGDVDWHKLSLVGGTSYLLTYSGSFSSSGAYFGIEDSQNLLLQAEGEGNSFTYTPTISGNYYLSFSPKLVTDTGSYSVRLSTLDPVSNRLLGSSGNNIFTSTVRDDFIDGGGGIDKVIFAGRLNEYAGSFSNGSVITATNRDSVPNRNGTDTLTNIERLKFSDISLALDIGPTQNAGSVYMLYKAAFNRPSDAGGMGYWISLKDGGANIVTSIAQGFVNSAEFVAKYGSNPSNSSYVNNLYQNVLGRAGEAGGVAYWTGEMDAGRVSKAQALVQFATLPEGAGIVAPLIANGIQYQEWLG